MGAAVPIIGMGLSAASSLGGGGGRTPGDPVAQYQADLMALEAARDNLDRSRALISSQHEMNDEFVQWSYDIASLELQNQYDSTLEQLKQQLQSNQIERQIQSASAEVDAFTRRSQTNLQQANLDFDLMQNERNIARQQQAIGAGDTFRDQQYGLNKSDIEADRYYAGVQKELASMGINLEGQRLDVKEEEVGTQLSQARTEADLQRSAAEIQESRDKSNTYREHSKSINRILDEMYGDEKWYGEFVARRAATGGRANLANVLRDMYGSPDKDRARQIAEYDRATGFIDADVRSGMTKLDANISELFAHKFAELAGQDIDLQRKGLQLEQAEVDTAYESHIGSLARDMMGLENQYRYDVFTQSILPMSELGDQLTASQWEHYANSANLGLESYQAEYQHALDSWLRETGEAADVQRYNQMLEEAKAELPYQQNALDASRWAGFSENESAASTQLVQALANQHGILSSLGGYSAGGGGGGGSLSGLASALKQGMQLFGQMGGRSNSTQGTTWAVDSNYQMNPWTGGGNTSWDYLDNGFSGQTYTGGSLPSFF